jgi:hypothetical protein
MFAFFISLLRGGGGGNLLDIRTYEKDCKKISELTNGKIGDIRLLGGEPLLHPDICEFLAITRKYFPEINTKDQIGIIELVTNGILLHEQSDNFWEICRKNSIGIFISDYPVKLKMKIIKEKAEQFNVQLKINSEKLQFHKAGSAYQWVKIPIDISGLQNSKKNFGTCFLAGNCSQLVKGKIYKCCRIAYINYFNTAFNKKLMVEENDYIDICGVKDGNELLHLLTKPASFCRYCKVDNITWDNKWELSKGIIDEYL